MTPNRPRKPLVGGNWKMNLLSGPGRELCEGLVAGLDRAPHEARSRRSY